MSLTSEKWSYPKELVERLSKEECIALIEALHYTAAAKTAVEVKEALLRIQDLLGFTRVIGGIASLNPDGAFRRFSNIVNGSYPDEWLQLYLRNGYMEIDPVFQSALVNQGTQHWQDVYASGTSEKHKEFVEAASEFGLVDGITTGTVDPACKVASFFSVASSKEIDASRYVPLVEYLGYYVHLSLMRIASAAESPLDHCGRKLTIRELATLNWIKNGKTNLEISLIMGVRERTVRFHVENILAKLNVSSRAQAVVSAIEHGLPNVV
jgi:DNA-binding CsgD family transcriptional regulator